MTFHIPDFVQTHIVWTFNKSTLPFHKAINAFVDFFFVEYVEQNFVNTPGTLFTTATSIARSA